MARQGYRHRIGWSQPEILTMTVLITSKRVLTMTCAAAILAVLPVKAEFVPGAGFVNIEPAFAEASGKRNRGADDSADDDDRRGRGADDGHKRGAKKKGKKLDKGGKKRRGKGGAGSVIDTTGPVRPVKIEVSGNNIEVKFSDGTKIEIENGRYERKNAAGRTVEQRAATPADRAALQALSVSPRVPSSTTTPPPADGTVRPVEIEHKVNGIEVEFSDGTKIEIENGRYERKNAAGRTVEERPATAADLAALRALQ
jgi:hypothetical protein